MIVPDMLRLNAAKYPMEVALVEVNPERQEDRHITWREYDLIETTGDEPYRREITWSVFDERANRLANLLLSRGVHKGDKGAIFYFGMMRFVWKLCRQSRLSKMVLLMMLSILLNAVMIDMFDASKPMEMMWLLVGGVLACGSRSAGAGGTCVDSQSA